MSEPLRIAVADDEPDMRDYFARILPHLGYRVVGVAANGEELLTLCRASAPDLVITDVKMPGLDGIDAAVQLYREMSVPVLLVSAHHDPELVKRAEAEHIVGYLLKPVKQADLQRVIALAMRRLEQVQESRKEATESV